MITEADILIVTRWLVVPDRIRLSWMPSVRQ